VEEVEGSVLKLWTEEIGQCHDDTARRARRSVTAGRETAFSASSARGRKGMEGQGLDGSRDTPLHVEQLAKMPGHAQHVEDTRRRWP
jgi:hypothetical protein